MINSVAEAQLLLLPLWYLNGLLSVLTNAPCLKCVTDDYKNVMLFYIKR